MYSYILLLPSLPPYWIFSLQRELSEVTLITISREKWDFATESMVSAQWTSNFATSDFFFF